MKNENFRYLFQYCDIPKDGQHYILTSPEANRKAILKAYTDSPYLAKYCYFPILVTRFIYNDDETRKLYHYLNHNDLEKILKTKTYLAGYQYEMNDSTEGKYSWNLAHEILKTMNPSSKILDMFEYERRVHPFDYYFMSFAKSDFNQALQNYGDVAIEIDPGKLHDILMKKYFPIDFKGLNSMKIGNAYSFVANIIYDKKIQEDYLSNTLHIWKNALALRKEQIFNFASMDLHFYSLIFKPWKYHQEEEVRFLISKIVGKGQKSYETMLNGKKKIKIPINNEVIKSVIVNHSADKIKNENIDSIEIKIKKMLEKNGFKRTTVRKTSLEY